jgi:TonB family protein
LTDTPPVEIDLTSPFLGPGAPHLNAPKAKIPGATLPARPVEQPIAPEQQVVPVKPPPPADVWKPQADLNKPPEPVPQQATQGGVDGGKGTSHLPGGSGSEGSDYGDPNGRGGGGGRVDVKPKLLNLDDVLANLRKYYPENERVAGREADVVIAIHIGADGAVSGVDVMASSGAAFDSAAGKVARLMKFAPAQYKGRPVPVKIKQIMQFRLD